MRTMACEHYVLQTHIDEKPRTTSVVSLLLLFLQYELGMEHFQSSVSLCCPACCCGQQEPPWTGLLMLPHRLEDTQLRPGYFLLQARAVCVQKALTFSRRSEQGLVSRRHVLLGRLLSPGLQQAGAC